MGDTLTQKLKCFDEYVLICICFICFDKLTVEHLIYCSIELKHFCCIFPEMFYLLNLIIFYELVKILLFRDKKLF